MSSLQIRRVVLITDCCDYSAALIEIQFRKELESLGVFDNSISFIPIGIPPFNVELGAFRALVFHHIAGGPGTLIFTLSNSLLKKPTRYFGVLRDGTAFLGANTGFLYPLFKSVGIQEIHQATWQGHISFGGLHYRPQLAAHIVAQSDKLDQFKGEFAEPLTELTFRQGQVVDIDNFGLIKMWDFVSDRQLSVGTTYTLEVTDKEGNIKGSHQAVFRQRMMNEADNTLVLYPGSSLARLDDRWSGLLELGIVRCPNSAAQLNVNIGDVITIA